jgi:hypothetical protein
MTHISHSLDAWQMENLKELPEGIEIATDGELIELVGGR